MKTLKCLLVLIAFTALSLVGCSDNSQSPIEPTDQSSAVGLNKKGPIVHSVNGSGLFFFNGKNAGARYAAHEYADGTFDGDFEVNSANATGDHDFKLNGEVISFKVYEGAGQYGGKMAVFLGNEKTGIFAGVYAVFFAIDNGNAGQYSAPDQVNGILMELPSLDFQIPAEWGSPWTGMTILDFYNMSPNDLINNLGILDCDKGNITVQ
jgi:hypothetical protein